MTSSGRIYAGRSPEDRREDRRSRLFAAALALIGSDGVATLTVRGVCTRAALTPRYFYEEFGTVDVLLRQLFDREFDAGMTRVGAAVAAFDAAGGAVNELRLRVAVGAVLEFLTESPDRAALLLTQASGSGLLAQRREERMGDIVALVTAYARSTYGTGEPPPPEEHEESDRALRSASTFVAGGLAQTIDAWIRGRIPGSDEVLRDELAAQILAVGDTASARLAARLGRQP